MKIVANGFMLAVLVILVGSGIVSAAHYIDAGSHLWSDPNNWLAVTVPTAGETTQMVGWAGSPEVCNITSGVNAVSKNLYVGQSTAGLTTTLNVMGTGTLAVGTNMSIAQYDELTIAEVNIVDSAIVAVGGVLAVGEGGTGTLRITGGTVTAYEVWITSWNSGSDGHIQLDGGLLQATANFWMGVAGMQSSMDINGGTLKVPYAYGSTIEGFIDAGKITARGLSGLNKFVVATDNATYWTFKALPEPPICVNPPSMDTNNDCKVDIVDFAKFAEQWMVCGYNIQSACW